MSDRNKAKSDTLYSRLVARVYDPFMEDLEQRFLIHKRRELLQGLRGNILEVGAGTGVNFPLYAPEARVLAIEPSENMLRYARRRLEGPDIRAAIELVHAGVGDEAAIRPPAGGFDAIVCTLVLCTIPDAEAAVDNFRRWLAPGGRLCVLEHIISERPAPRILQKLVNPVWKACAEGCHLTRQTDELLKEKGFAAEWEEYFVKGLLFYRAVMRDEKYD